MQASITTRNIRIKANETVIQRFHYRVINDVRIN